ncbi:hypothetical protein B0H10DRAFT_2075275, partial [Mycena sp. CBHHK59/15]
RYLHLAHVQPDALQSRFPPFPDVPEGVTILPFKDFKECGIQRTLDTDGIEKDTLGIPTIRLRVKHDTDVSKTNPNPKKTDPASSFGPSRAGPAFGREWWRTWEEGESLRTLDFDAAVSLTSSQLRIFLGLLGTVPVWQKASDLKVAEDEEISDDDFDEDDSKSKFVNQNGQGDRRFPPRLRPREPYELYGVQVPVVETDDEIQNLFQASRAKKYNRLQNFLNDPERSIQIFLSSHMKNQGLFWADRNLTNAPQLLRFFVEYLLRNRVLPDQASERSLKNVLDIIKIASKELPLTPKISKALPDNFSMACQSYWGRQVTWSFTLSDSDGDSATGERDAKRSRLDDDGDAAFESVLKAENIELIKQDDVLGAGAVHDGSNDTDTTAVDGADWGSGSWGSTEAYDPTVFTPPADAKDSWGGAPYTIDWVSPSLPTLLSVLGPTALPLTHVPGVVEQSVRRITSITAPLEVTGAVEAHVDGCEPSPDAVERELEEKLYRVELGPWPRWDSDDSISDFSVPRILRTSLDSSPAVPNSDESSASSSSVLGPLHHVEDTITILFEPAVVDTLCVGMGLGGTWVQLARVQDVAHAGDVEPSKPNAKAEVNVPQGRRVYWYLDELAMVLPSYWFS